jgi:hypothetical protein
VPEPGRRRTGPQATRPPDRHAPHAPDRHAPPTPGCPQGLPQAPTGRDLPLLGYAGPHLDRPTHTAGPVAASAPDIPAGRVGLSLGSTPHGAPSGTLRKFAQGRPDALEPGGLYGSPQGAARCVSLGLGPGRFPPAGSPCPWARHRLAPCPRHCANLRKVDSMLLSPE